MLAKFGGVRTKLKGTIEAVQYGPAGFAEVWILVQRGDNEPSENHAIDHLSWRSTEALSKTIDGFRAQNVTVLNEPRALTLPNGPPVNIAFIAGPAGLKIEMVERPGLKPGE